MDVATQTAEQEYFDLRGAARYLHLSVNYMVELARKGGGPPRSKIGKCVRYSKRDLRDWMESRKV